jgi:hypothetical protein
MRMADQDVLVPNPLNSDRQYYRFHHLDLPDLDDTELADELNYLRPLLWGLDSEHWFRERVMMLENELRKRKGDKPAMLPKSKPTGVIPL